MSMDDLTFGDRMPKGYVEVIGSGSSSQTIDKTVWTIVFFDMVKSELSNSAGLHKLIWKAKVGSGDTPKTL